MALQQHFPLDANRITKALNKDYSGPSFFPCVRYGHTINI